MIPKVIHYCWFGGNQLPELAQKCIESWKKYFPDYEIKEWNESNFDLNCCDYVKEAYTAKKWAFVSDYARFWILYNYGGLYFDTDVEVIRDMSEIVNRGAFMGCEAMNKCAPGLGLGVNPGLGLGVNPGLGLYKEILDFYHTIHFVNKDGTLNEQTVVLYTTNILKKHGFKKLEQIQYVAGIYIYPEEYFCPLNYGTGKLTITNNTFSIHHYSASWHSKLDSIVDAIERCGSNNKKIEYRCRRIISFPFRVANKIKKNGIKNTAKFIIKKLGGCK